MMNLEPVLKAPALVLGTLIHKVLPDWAAGADAHDAFISYSAEEIVKITTHYSEVVGCKPNADEMKGITDAIALGDKMITRYIDYYKTPFPNGLRLVASEQTLTVDVPGTEHCIGQCKGCVTGFCIVGQNCLESSETCCLDCVELHKLEATLDGVLADEFNNLYILEHKTFDRHPTDVDLANNDQFLAYMWALKQSAASMGLPEDVQVRGVAYNGLWKRAEVPKGKTLDDMFVRKLLLRNGAELDEFGTYLAVELNDMARLKALADTGDTSQLYKNVPPLGGCWDCGAFRNLCSAQSRGQDLTYMIQSSYTHRERYYSEEESA